MQLISENIAGNDPTYNLSYIKKLQKEIDTKVAKSINAFRNSKKNDLSLCFNEEGVWKLGMYYNILEQIKYCNACFECYEIKDIVGLVKTELTKI